MLRTLVRREILDNLLTLRLAVALGVATLLSILTALIGSVDYAQSMDAYRAVATRTDQVLQQAHVWAELEPHIVVPPQPLFILCRGTSEVSGLTFYVSPRYIGPPSMHRNAYTNDFMATLTQVDFTTVVMLLLSFLAVALGFDGICGERERGTLPLVLANPLPRGRLIAAKLIGGCLSLWIPLALAMVVSLLILAAQPAVHLAGEDWVRLALLFALCCAFLGQVFALSLMVSTCTRQASTALLLCLVAWLVAGVGYASLLPSLVRYGTYEPPWQEFVDQTRALRATYDGQVAAWVEQHPGPGPAYLKGIEEDGALRYAHPRGYQWMAQRNAFAVPAQVELAEERYKLLWANQAPLAAQSRDVDRWSLLSPFTNFRTLAKLLARSTLDDMFALATYGRRYRETFLSYLRDRDAFTSRRWFTDDPEDQEPLIPDPEAVTDDRLAPDAPYMKSRMAWAADQQQRAAQDPRRRLDLADLPRFGGPWRRSLSESLGLMLPGLLSLALVTALAVFVAVWRFQRYDPR
ncbi:MAG: ABC transporter permease subunit [Candidatus Latescibacterota bacterium]